MGGKGYLQVADNSVFSVVDVEKAYKALSDAVENRAYNFGELRLDKNNRLEIINNHKNTFFHSNNTITTAEENQRARAAAFAILDAKYKGTVDTDTLALVRNFLCGDKAIADQPLTRDEVANMIKLLKKGTVNKDSALVFLKNSYEFKHGQTDGVLAPGMNSYAQAKENRISKNIFRANERQQVRQKEELKSMFEQGASNDQIMRTVLKGVMRNPIEKPPAVRLLATLNDPARLSVAEDAKTYIRNAVAVYTRESIGQSPKGPEFLAMMMRQRSADIIKGFGGDNQTAGCCQHGKYAVAFNTMQTLALKDMLKDNVDDETTQKRSWTSVVNDFVQPKRTSMLDDIAGGELRKTATAKLCANFEKLMSLPEPVKPEDLRAAFKPMVDVLSRPEWKLGFSDVLCAFFDTGGDLEKTRAELGELKSQLGEKLAASELKALDTAANSAKSQVLADKVLGQKEKDVWCAMIDKNFAHDRDRLLQREQPLAEAATLVEFLDTLLEKNDGKARDFLKALTFANHAEVAPSKRPASFELSMIAGWLAGSAVDTPLNDLTRDLGRKIDACRKGTVDDKKLDALMKTCERQIVSLCDKILTPAKWGANGGTGIYFGEQKPIFSVVSNGSKKLVESYQGTNINDLVSDFELEEASAKVGKDIGNPDELRKKLSGEKKAAFEKLQQEFLFGTKQVVEQKPVGPVQTQTKGTDSASSVDKAASDRIGKLTEYFENFLEKNRKNYEGLVSNIDGKLDAYAYKYEGGENDVDSLQNAVATALSQVDKNSGIVDTVKLMISSMPYVESDSNNLVKGGLTHEPIHLDDIVAAFTQEGAVERNKRIFSATQARCEQEFGMSKEDVRLFVDPAVVAISIKSFDYDRFGQSAKVPSELQLDRIMQFAIAKAKTVLESEDKNITDGDKNRAQAFLWKMQESVKAARSQLADQFWPLVNELKPDLSDVNFERKLEAIILNENNGGSEGKRLIGDIGKLLVNSSDKKAKYTYKDTKIKKTLGISHNSTQEYSITSNMSDKISYERVDRSRDFWRGMNTFLHRLDRLQATITKFDVNVQEPVDKTGGASREFVNKVRARFGGAPFTRDEKVDKNDENSIKIKKVDKERFKDFVNVDGSKQDLLRTNYSLSFVF